MDRLGRLVWPCPGCRIDHWPHTAGTSDKMCVCSFIFLIKQQFVAVLEGTDKWWRCADPREAWTNNTFNCLITRAWCGKGASLFPKSKVFIPKREQSVLCFLAQDKRVISHVWWKTYLMKWQNIIINHISWTFTSKKVEEIQTWFCKSVSPVGQG